MWATRTPFPLSSSPPLFRLIHGKPVANLSFSLRLFSTTSESATVADPSTALHESHPWPEWVEFIDKLKSTGYFSSSESNWDSHVYTDMTLLKEPCLTFARDRYDLMKSLSQPDIKKLVHHGCPNLLRKAVNSSKRLRAYVRLDEADVCAACNLRGSCDRAYAVLNDSESSARTIDIVRVLLFHALDPLVLKSEEKLDREDMETAAKSLLSQVIELSKNPPDPSIPKPINVPRFERVQRQKQENEAEMKRGDWMCPKCEYLNYSRNLRCLKCHCEGPKFVGENDTDMKKGDWICIRCKFMNFSRNRDCIKCGTQGPKRVDMRAIEMKKGDWNCPRCDFMNFASNKVCLRCEENRPKQMLNPGEWECPSCDYLNYRRNTFCLKCNADKPKPESENEDEHQWRSPY